MSIEDQPTQRLRRPSEPPMPGSMSPTPPQPAGAARTDGRDDGTTDVLSLDNLFEGPPAAAAPEVTTAPTATPVVSTQPVGPAEPPPPAPVERRMTERRGGDRRVGDRRAGAVAPAPAPRQPGPGHRLRRDTTAALRGGVNRTGHWFTTGDNALIVATVLVAVAFILVIGLI